MIELFTRLVVAFERIAECLMKMANPLVTIEPAAATVAQPADAPSTVSAGGPMNYEAIGASPGGYAVLKGICNQRGIEVKPKTKTPTLIKMLQTADAVAAAGGATPANPPVTADPFATDDTAAADPLGADPLGAAPAVEVTFDMCLNLLKEIAVSKGSPVVAKIIKEHGGVDMFKDVPKDKYAAIYNAALAVK